MNISPVLQWMPFQVQENQRHILKLPRILLQCNQTHKKAEAYQKVQIPANQWLARETHRKLPKSLFEMNKIETGGRGGEEVWDLMENLLHKQTT